MENLREGLKTRSKEDEKEIKRKYIMERLKEGLKRRIKFENLK